MKYNIEIDFTNFLEMCLNVLKIKENGYASNYNKGCEPWRFTYNNNLKAFILAQQYLKANKKILLLDKLHHFDKENGIIFLDKKESIIIIKGDAETIIREREEIIERRLDANDKDLELIKKLED